MARGGGGFGGGSGRGAAPEPRVAQGNFWAPPGLKAPPHRQRCRPSPERLDLRRPQDWNEAGERKESGGEHRITCSWGGGGGVRKWAAPPTLCLYLGSSTSRTAVGAARRSREGVSSSRDLGGRGQIKDPQDTPPKTPNHTRIPPSPFQTPDPHSSESTEFPQFHSQMPPDPPPPSETPVTPPPNYVSLPFPKSPPGPPSNPLQDLPYPPLPLHQPPPPPAPLPSTPPLPFQPPTSSPPR